MAPHDDKTIYGILGRHSVHPFPARMAPDLALDVVARCEGELRVLDPMSGSGTVLAVAGSRGHFAVGVDIDPLAVLIARVWTTPIESRSLRERAVKVLDDARRRFSFLKVRDAYPENADSETRRFIRYWFDDYARRQLASLSAGINNVENHIIRRALWCSFSRLIITKQSGASRAMDLSHSRPHRVFARAPSKPFRNFLSAVDRVAKNCIDGGPVAYGSAIRVEEGDARNLSLNDGTIDLVLTSPPYLNAIDYLRCSKFSLVWMGHSAKQLRDLRSTVVGAEVGKDITDDPEIVEILSNLKLQPQLPKRQESILSRYIDDLRRVVRETARVLTDHGQAVYVVGENTMRGTYIPNSLIVEAVARAVGLHCVARHSRELPASRRYLPPPSKHSNLAGLDGRMRREVVLKLKKVA